MSGSGQGVTAPPALAAVNEAAQLMVELNHAAQNGACTLESYCLFGHACGRVYPVCTCALYVCVCIYVCVCAFLLICGTLGSLASRYAHHALCVSAHVRACAAKASAKTPSGQKTDGMKKKMVCSS
jgi:hypothetical protein